MDGIKESFARCRAENRVRVRIPNEEAICTLSQLLICSRSQPLSHTLLADTQQLPKLLTSSLR